MSNRCLISPREPSGDGRPDRRRKLRIHPARVAAIRTLVEATELPHREIARVVGVCPATVGALIRERGWSGPDGWARLSRRHGRPYGPETVAAVRALVEGTALPYGEIARRTGVSSVIACRWRHREGWRRPAEAATATSPGPTGSREARRQARIRRRHENRVRQESEVGFYGRQKPPRILFRTGQPYRADTIEAVWVLVVGTSLSNRMIAFRTGVSEYTVLHWTRKRGWQRPPAALARSARARRTAPLAGSGRGRPYAPEVVAKARELYQTTELSRRMIAARAKVGLDTVGRWARKHGWTRPRTMPDPYGRVRRGRRWVSVW